MTAAVELSREFAAASTDDLADALAQRIELLDPQHLFDAWAAATARYWRRRGAAFEAARPRPGDFHGRATRDELNARWVRLTAIAKACHARADVAERFGVTDVDRGLMVDVTTALLEVA